jgi:hypothetical protein
LFTLPAYLTSCCFKVCAWLEAHLTSTPPNYDIVKAYFANTNASLTTRACALQQLTKSFEWKEPLPSSVTIGAAPKISLFLRSLLPLLDREFLPNNKQSAEHTTPTNTSPSAVDSATPASILRAFESLNSSNAYPFCVSFTSSLKIVLVLLRLRAHHRPASLVRHSCSTCWLASSATQCERGHLRPN